MIRIMEALGGLVPAAKPLGIIISLLATGWLGGVGFALGFGETAASIKLVPEIKATLEQHAIEIVAVQNRLDNAEAADIRIMCLASLSATGQVVDPLDIDRECP